MRKSLKKRWKKHGHFVITGGQIITILTLIAGIYANHVQALKNAADIKHSEKWIGDNLGDKTTSISNLQRTLIKVESIVTNLDLNQE